MTKLIKSVLAASLLSIASTSANAATVVDFTGDYEVSNWTAFIASGSLDTTNAPFTVGFEDHTGLNVNPFPVRNEFTIAATTSGQVSFDWDRLSIFSNGFPGFGWLSDGVFNPLNDFDSFGSETFQVTKGEVFGFGVDVPIAFNTIPGVFTVSNFKFDETVSAVPEPSTYALMLGGLGLVGFMAARRRKQA